MVRRGDWRCLTALSPGGYVEGTGTVDGVDSRGNVHLDIILDGVADKAACSAAD